MTRRDSITLTQLELARFFSKVSVSYSTGCWEWTGGWAGKRYGRLSFRGDDEYSHRLAYRAFVGRISDGLEIDHLCRVPLCVNPAHLEAVTHAENCRRGDQRAGNSNLRKTHCPLGHPYDSENTRRKPNGWRVCRTCERRLRRVACQVA